MILRNLATFLLIVAAPLLACAQAGRVLSGTVVTSRQESISGAMVRVTTKAGETEVITDGTGAFRLEVPDAQITIRVGGSNLEASSWTFEKGSSIEGLRLVVEYTIPAVHDSIVITSSVSDPRIDRRQSAVFTKTLFSRDDQVFHLLDAGISAGQHEGGGKSLEVRRFGFNTDHGGVNGGLKVLVDNFQQNQGTQGHGQGYLGQLKSLSPELVEEVDIVNGPFNAEYGDFSGLGVVHIRLRESLPDLFTSRIQGGSFDTFRSFAGYSPGLERARALITYEASRTDGPFINPLRYARDNIAGNFTRIFSDKTSFGFKLNAGRNDFTSSGQIPLDHVASGTLDRFGFIDPHNAGRVRTGFVGGYFRHQAKDGATLKLDGFLARSLFDLWSNFTFFLNDEINGDEILQHDSRLQQGANIQYLRSLKFAGTRGLLIAGGNFHDNQINVGLDRSIARTPFEITTKGNAHVTNSAAYVSQSVDLIGSRLHLEGAVRFDHFRFGLNDRMEPSNSGVQHGTRFQPKASLAFTPTNRVPFTFYFNYGRGISSQDARGVTQRPDGPKIATTDFYQTGFAQNFSRFSFSGDFFLIDRSNEQVYIPDDGSFEFQGASRSYGFEIKTSMRLTRYLSFNGGVTRVSNAFFRGTLPRAYVDSAPHAVANAALTFGDVKGFSGSIRYRHTGNYRLDPLDANIRASGLDIIDLSVTRQLRRWIEFGISIDNLTNKTYYETQNFFESRTAPGMSARERIHATPGYPLTLTAGVTFRIGKD